jgi:phenylpropionate dioxygenase-like ring-hydroxylating dioxygenase large terminal subunit
MMSIENLLGSNVLADVVKPYNEAMTLPRECYISDDFFEFELDVIWRREWICVGHVSQIPNVGDHFPVTIGSDPLIVMRSSEDKITAFSSVCRHRAMLLADKPGNCDRLVCQYHGWQYDLTGQLVGAPAMGRAEGFDPTQIALPQLAVDLWKGFIFLTFRSEPPPVADALLDLEPIIGGYGLEELTSVPPASTEFAYNWKVFMENAMECYHCTYLHPEQHDCAPSRNTQPERLPDHPAVVVVSVTTTHPDASFVPPDYTVCFPPLEGLSVAQRHEMHWIGVLPNLLLGFYPDSVQFVTLLPGGTEKTRMTFGWLFPPEVMEAPEFQATYDHQSALIAPMLQQDFDACEMVQRGLHATLAGRGRLSWQEETFNHFDHWLVSRYQRDGA